jgi:hypothetical protein
VKLAARNFGSIRSVGHRRARQTHPRRRSLRRRSGLCPNAQARDHTHRSDSSSYCQSPHHTPRFEPVFRQTQGAPPRFTPFKINKPHPINYDCTFSQDQQESVKTRPVPSTRFTTWFTPWLLPCHCALISACASRHAMFTLTPITQW